MRGTKLAMIMVALVAGQALGTSVVSFELGLGGDNHGGNCNPDGSGKVLFTGHNPADGQVLSSSRPITWDVVVSASGTHNVGGTDYPIRGVANFVFSLELHSGSVSGPLVSSATFYSSTNNGTACPKTASAAFAMSFFCSPYRTSSPGRVIDAYYDSSGGYVNINGPWMYVNVYPTNPSDGRLLGMGAGYAKWVRSSNAERCTAGIGQVAPAPGDPFRGPQGRGPVCEGQISGLAVGTYVLKLIPGGGINVLRGDKDLNQAQNAFAIPADTTVGDTITFLVVPCCDCTLQGWSAVRTHGSCGELGIAATGSATAWDPIEETRRQLPDNTQKLVATFGSNVSSSYNAAVAVIVAPSVPATHTLANGGTQLRITLNNTAPGTKYTVDISNLIMCLAPGQSKSITLAICPGDVNGDGSVDLIDMVYVKSKNTHLATEPGMAKFDANMDCSIDLIDMASVKNLNGSGCPPKPW